MEPVKNFEWNDLLLTAKGWYESTGSLTTDFAIAIERNENRSIRIGNKNDSLYVAKILMNVVMPSLWEVLPKEEIVNRCWLHRSDDFYNEVSNKMHFFDVSFADAVILAGHNILCNCVELRHITFNKPVYWKGRRRLVHGSSRNPKSMTYKEMNAIASRFFDNDK